MVLNIGLKGAHMLITGKSEVLPSHARQPIFTIAYRCGYGNYRLTQRSTGGTRGMGRQIVETFLLEEVNVSYCARTVDDSDFADFHESLPASNTARAVGTSVDVSSKDALYSWIKKAGDRFGRIDTVIANGKIAFYLFHPNNSFIDR